MKKSTTKEIKTKISKYKKKLDKLEEEYFNQGCDCCEDIQYQLDTLEGNIDELLSILE